MCDGLYVRELYQPDCESMSHALVLSKSVSVFVKVMFTNLCYNCSRVD